MKLKRFLITIFFAILSSGAFAINDTIILKSEMYSEKITRDLDSLVNSWYVKMAMKEFSFEFDNDSTGKEYPDSLYQARLRKVNSIIKLPYNSIIRNLIHVYTVKQRDKFSAVLGLMTYYFPMIEDIFDSYGIPVELKYMAVIESALNANAVSRVGATGMWQFMYSTGRFYGLTINSLVDERRDPVRATHAAARYIKDLYDIYHDWILVIAAYNCGPGNANKAIRRSGNRKDYWDIYYRLPRETRGYIRNMLPPPMRLIILPSIK
jgi:membrane-bound lytic murein transglycosylase D